MVKVINETEPKLTLEFTLDEIKVLTFALSDVTPNMQTKLGIHSDPAYKMFDVVTDFLGKHGINWCEYTRTIVTNA